MVCSCSLFRRIFSLFCFRPDAHNGLGSLLLSDERRGRVRRKKTPLKDRSKNPIQPVFEPHAGGERAGTALKSGKRKGRMMSAVNRSRTDNKMVVISISNQCFVSPAITDKYLNFTPSYQLCERQKVMRCYCGYFELNLGNFGFYLV